MQTYYNDNLRLNPGPHSAVWGAIGDVSAKLGVRSEISGLSLTPRLRDYRYEGFSGASGYNHLARSLGTNAFYQTETALWSLNASYDRDSTLTSELLDSGRVNINIPRESVSVQPSWVAQWTPRVAFQVDGAYTRTSYKGGLAHGLRDYRVIDASAALHYNLTERQRLSLTVSGSRYTAPSFLDDRTDSYTVEGSWRNHWTERTVTRAGGGLLVNRSQLNVFGLPVENTNRGYVLHANIQTGSERTTWSAHASRNVHPTSFGVLMQRDTAQVRMIRGMTPHLHGFVDGLWMHSKSLNNSFESIDRTLEQVALKIRWAYSVHWALDAGYRWTRQDFGRAAGHSNEVFLNLRYNGNRSYVSY